MKTKKEKSMVQLLVEMEKRAEKREKKLAAKKSKKYGPGCRFNDAIEEACYKAACDAIGQSY